MYRISLGKSTVKTRFKGAKVFDRKSTTGITEFQIFKVKRHKYKLKDFHTSRAHRGEGSGKRLSVAVNRQLG